MTSVNVRELVLDILMEVNEKEQYSHLVIRDVLNKYQYLEKQERAFLTRLAEGTIEHMLEMDFIINSFSKVKVKKIKNKTHKGTKKVSTHIAYLPKQNAERTGFEPARRF